jgi:hypothetical protein
VAWILVVLGIAVTAGGLWLLARSPAASDSAAEVEVATTRAKAVGETPWDVLMSPVEGEESSKPDRRRTAGPFRMGLLLGLGFGVAATAAVWTVWGNGTPSKEDVLRLAKEYDLVVVEQPAAPTATGATGEGQTATGATGTGTTGQTTTSTTAAPAPKTVTVSVVAGDLWPNVAAKMKENGLIQDENAFLAKVTEMGAEPGLQQGVFTLDTSMSVEDMINKLTGK